VHPVMRDFIKTTPELWNEDTYMTKKYGEDYSRYHTIYDYEAFDDWLRGKEGDDNYASFD
jgi:hypothetical protein